MRKSTTTVYSYSIAHTHGSPERRKSRWIFRLVFRLATEETRLLLSQEERREMDRRKDANGSRCSHRRRRRLARVLSLNVTLNAVHRHLQKVVRKPRTCPALLGRVRDQR